MGDTLGSFAKNLTRNCHCLQRQTLEGLSIKRATFVKQVHFLFCVMTCREVAMIHCIANTLFGLEIGS